MTDEIVLYPQNLVFDELLLNCKSGKLPVAYHVGSLFWPLLLLWCWPNRS
ncbi:unnamed protein product [Periconia digitata]|uniref:Uncharacterized protein n=1 Tax=Periconia digitata TaxID=1303443 RepID=A0A9W4UAQ5_9PLEO|nr:unnamed protein product [Periconia digitata]